MRLALIPLTGVALIALAGCVPQNQYDDLMTAYRAKEQQLLQMQNEFDTARANEALLRKQLGEAMASLSQIKDSGNRAEIEALQTRIADLMKQIGETKLPTEVSDAILVLVNENPDLIEFDPKTGIIRFKSDVTFDSGSAKLSTKAQSVLARFAEILNSDRALDLEVRVVGHTDNVRIARKETLAQHPTNVHLSAHRAIAVREALVKDGVGANRFMVAGYGEFRPVTENGRKGNEENRRVEVYLVQMPKDALKSTEASTPAVATESTTASGAATTEENLK